MFAMQRSAMQSVESACGPQPSEQEPGFELQHDTPTHIDVGDDAPGQDVVIKGVIFTPGEIAALVDYVGTVEQLNTYDEASLTKMKGLLEEGSEDAAAWDEATGGYYSVEAQNNEKHFAPGGGGPDHRSAFVELFSEALRTAQEAQEDEASQDELMNLARQYGYAAEHYLQDAFSAGHKVAAGNVVSAVDALLEANPFFDTRITDVARAVFQREPDRIALFEYGGVLGFWNVIDSEAEFVAAVTACHLYTRTAGRDLMYDSARKAVHDRLEGTGVECVSPAHPTPWVISGDHNLDASPETREALLAALSDTRDMLELGAVPGMDPEQIATRLFDLHCPVPTGDGRRLVEETLAEVTASPDAFVGALADVLAKEVEAVLDTAAAQTDLLRRRPGLCQHEEEGEEHHEHAA